MFLKTTEGLESTNLVGPRFVAKRHAEPFDACRIASRRGFGGVGLRPTAPHTYYRYFSWTYVGLKHASDSFVRWQCHIFRYVVMRTIKTYRKVGAFYIA